MADESRAKQAVEKAGQELDRIRYELKEQLDATWETSPADSLPVLDRMRLHAENHREFSAEKNRLIDITLLHNEIIESFLQAGRELGKLADLVSRFRVVKAQTSVHRLVDFLSSVEQGREVVSALEFDPDNGIDELLQLLNSVRNSTTNIDELGNDAAEADRTRRDNTNEIKFSMLFEEDKSERVNEDGELPVLHAVRFVDE